MRNMAFSKTTPQIIGESKDITRRDGWDFLQPGDRLCAIEKGQGLKKGETVKRLKIIEVVSTRWEPLEAITQDDVRREGFPEWTPEQFIQFYLKGNRGKTRKSLVNRIEFKYIQRELC